MTTASSEDVTARTWLGDNYSNPDIPNHARTAAVLARAPREHYPAQLRKLAKRARDARNRNKSVLASVNNLQVHYDPETQVLTYKHHNDTIVTIRYDDPERMYGTVHVGKASMSTKRLINAICSYYGLKFYCYTKDHQLWAVWAYEGKGTATPIDPSDETRITDR